MPRQTEMFIRGETTAGIAATLVVVGISMRLHKVRLSATARPLRACNDRAAVMSMGLYPHALPRQEMFSDGATGYPTPATKRGPAMWRISNGNTTRVPSPRCERKTHARHGPAAAGVADRPYINLSFPCPATVGESNDEMCSCQF